MSISVEFFPPKNSAGFDNFQKIVTFCAQNVRPDFVSLTFGAGGSNANLPFSLEAIGYMAGQDLTVAAHLPHAGRTREETLTILQKFHNAGAQMVVALRGDLPNSPHFASCPNGYNHTADFIKDIRKAHPQMPIWVAGYPEKHPESKSVKTDTKNLKSKIDAGATGILGQFCFNAEQVLKRHEQWIEEGIQVTFRPGVIALINPTRIFEMATRCQAKVPAEIRDSFTSPEIDPLSQAISLLSTQIQELVIKRHTPHVYALNNMQVMQALAQMRSG